MTAALPSLEVAPAGTKCPQCGADVFLIEPIFCEACFEAALEEQRRLERLARIQRDLAEVCRRVRVWRTLHGRTA